jgi:hypothetical protein
MSIKVVEMTLQINNLLQRLGKESVAIITTQITDTPCVREPRSLYGVCFILFDFFTF